MNTTTTTRKSARRTMHDWELAFARLLINISEGWVPTPRQAQWAWSVVRHARSHGRKEWGDRIASFLQEHGITA